MNWSEVWEEIRVLFKFAIPLTLVITGLTALVILFIITIPIWAAIVVAIVWTIAMCIGIIIVAHWVVEKGWV